ncbi:MAG: hypothetical protein ACI9WS_002197, partial [Paraglaciecola psychrophila]
MQTALISTAMKTALIRTGRTLLALYFLYPGIMKF